MSSIAVTGIMDCSAGSSPIPSTGKTVDIQKSHMPTTALTYSERPCYPVSRR